MNWTDYQAIQVLGGLNGGKPKSIEEVVLEAMHSFPRGCKREELASQVSSRTGISFLEVRDNISPILRRMKDDGILTNPVRGYWILAQRLAV